MSVDEDDAGRPLSGIQVVELSSSLAGPYLGMCLGDLGAEVIKVENPGGGDMTRQWSPPEVAGESAYFLSTNRNKRSVGLDLQTEAGRELLLRLVERADVVIDNFRPDSTLHRLLSYEVLSQRNPRLVMVHLSAFGETGPWRDRPGYDLIAQAAAGLMSVTGEPDGVPVRAGFSIADLSAGMFGLAGVLAALVERSRTQRGRYITTSLFEAQLGLHVNLAMNLFLSGDVPQPLGTAHPNLAPYQVFSASDGYLVIAAGNDRLYQRLCAAIERPELAQDARFRTNRDRVTHRGELVKILEDVLVYNTVDHWCAVLEGSGVPVSPLLNISDVYAHAHTEALGMVRSVEHIAGPIPQVASPLSLDGKRLTPRSAPPTLGQHTTEVLSELGVDSDTQAALRASGTIR
ncbi:CaiB/BaiF CoA transferase family protein [Streptomyces sp. NPDC056653]|uniref:CaiB/BaiF CoA transferase family protein n=1 Tax=Streptomyces sp. NPDC056653 TaxID=3345894 RepID=UPI003692624B